MNFRYWLAVSLVLMTTALGQPVIPIDSVRLLDANGVPVLLGTTVSVTGIITAGPQFGTAGPGYMQDSTAGVALYGSAISGVDIGDSVVVTALVDSFRGLLELKNPSISRIAATDTPEARVITLAQVDDTLRRRERYEGMLVKITSARFGTGGNFAGGQTYTISDISGSGTVYIDPDAASIIGQPIPDYPVEVTGCVSQSDYSSPFWGYYRILPRFIADIDSGSSGPVPQVSPIAEAVVDADSNSIPDRVGEAFIVTGVVTMPSGIMTGSLYIQDASGGVKVYYGSSSKNYRLGDSVVVQGSMEVYRGEPELTNATITVEDSGHALPEPLPMNCRTMSKTRHGLGQLVKLTGVGSSSRIVLSSSRYDINYLVDTSGMTTLYVYRKTGVPGLMLPPDSFSVVGVKGIEDTTAPYDTGFRILPRSRADFNCWMYAETMQLRTIADVQTPGTGGYSSRYENQWVKVKGRLTGPSHIFAGGSSPSFYIEDATNGINVYAPYMDSFTTPRCESLGFEFTCIGLITEYSGLTEIANGVAWLSDSIAVPVVPTPIAYGDFLTEQKESKLVRVVGDVITPPSSAGGGQNFTIRNGNAGIAVRAVDAAGIFLGNIVVGRRVDCTGIVGQYASSPPYGSGYQLMLRFPSDLADSTPDSTPGTKLGFAAFEPESRVFNPGARIPLKMSITSPGNRKLTLQVFDLEGRLVRDILVNVPGRDYKNEVWDGTDNSLRPVPVGTYVLNLRSVLENGKSEVVRKLVVLGTKLK